MPTILLTNKYSPEVFQLVRSWVPEGFTLIQLDDLSQNDLVRKAPLADYFLASGRLKIDAEVIQAAVNLKMVQRTGVGTDTIDKAALADKGIPLQVNQGVNARSVAEHTLMFMLALLRRAPQIDRQVREGIWKKNETGLSCYTLEGKTVGLVGLGNIGKEVAKMLQPFRVHVLYHKTSRLSQDEEQDLQVSYESFKALLNRSDIVSLHCPLTPQTKEIINPDTICQMKKGAWLVNTARGGLVDEHALTQALESSLLSGAALDVFSSEPLPPNHKLCAQNNVIVSPHIAGLPYECYQDLMNQALTSIAKWHTTKTN